MKASELGHLIAITPGDSGPTEISISNPDLRVTEDDETRVTEAGEDRVVE